MKKKLIIIVTVAIVSLLLIAGGIFYYLKLNTKSEDKNVALEEVNLKEDMLSINCQRDNIYAYEPIGGDDFPKIDPGIQITCSITFTNYTKEDISIKTIEFDYDIQKNDTEDFNFFEENEFSFEEKKDNHIIINMSKNSQSYIIEKPVNYTDGTIERPPYISEEVIGEITGIPFLAFRFRIKSIPSNDKFIISIKNIKLIGDKKIYNNVDHTSTYDINLDSKYKYERKENPNQFIFYKNNDNGYQEINKYECKGECFVYAAQCFSYVNLEIGRMFIIDNNKAILFDINKGILGEYETPLYNIYDTSNDQYKSKYFVGRKEKDGKYGIVDYNGNVIKDYNSLELGTKLVCDINDETYSVTDNLITIKNSDNKYGITRITKDELLTDYKFDDIRLYNDKYYKAKVGDKWYLYSFENNEKAIEEGFKQIFMPTDNILFVQDGDYLYIKDYTGKNITEEKIQVLSDYNEQACCGATYGTYVFLDSENSNIIHIVIDNGKTWGDGFEQYKYEYNIKNNSLSIKKDSSQ